MAKKPTYSSKPDSKWTANGAPKVEWKGYLNVNLTDWHKNDYKERVSKGQSFLASQDVMDLLQNGYTLKVGYDEKNKAYQATLYCQQVGSDHAGYALAARASDHVSAMERVAYIHMVVLEGVWITPEEKDGWNDERW